MNGSSEYVFIGLRHLRCCFQAYIIILLLSLPVCSMASAMNQPYLIKDINSAGSSSPEYLTKSGNTLFFRAMDGVSGHWDLWKSNGTTAGTVKINAVGLQGLLYLTDVNGTLFFAGSDSNGLELWKSDGTDAGTVLIKDINLTGSSTPQNLTNVNGSLFFTADNGIVGRELWKSNGTAAGTALVYNLNYSSTSSNPQNLVAMGDKLYFSGTSSSNDYELYKSDGTGAGTLQVKDIYTGTFGSNPAWLTPINGTLFFSAYHSLYGTELWKSDGTSSGTALVKDINLNANPNSSNPSNLTNVNGILYFSAVDGNTGNDLWISDGTATGTVRAKEFYYTPDIANFTQFKNKLFFTANDSVNGTELWQSDGTLAGTFMVTDINPGSASSSPANLTAFNDLLFFSADNGVNGRELWVTDGTASGTMMVADIETGPAGSSPEYLVGNNSTLFFRATTSQSGSELWALPIQQDITVLPSTVDFNTVTIGSTATASLSLSNPGYLPLVVTTPITITGADSSMFSVVPGGDSPCSSLTPTIPPAQNCTLALAFTPTATGDRSAAAQILSNAPAMQTLTVPLAGKGVPVEYSLVLQFSSSGSGKIDTAPSPPGIQCANNCSQSFPSGTVVTLTPTAVDGYAFLGWIGACSGTSSCQVTMDGHKNISATFADITPPDTIITSSPMASTTSTSFSFTFSAAEIGSTFECKLGNSSWGTCTSPYSNSLVYAQCTTCRVNNQLSFSVRAKDPAGNSDPTPATWWWTINYPPNVPIDNVQDGGLVQLPATDFTNDLTFSKEITFSLKGGYASDYQSQAGMTTIHGTITITAGTVNIENIVIAP